ncbi:MAG: thiamine phosphate synthase [Anaerotignaceae bacterium]
MNKDDLKVYLVTDNNALNGRDFFEVVEQALKGGVTIVQLREKMLETPDFLKKANRLKQLTQKYNVPLIINDRMDIAFDSKADGLHVGQKDIAVRDGRRIMRKDYSKILGVTANTVALSQEAEKMGADYLGVGAVFGTTTKADAKPLTIQALKEIVESVSIPVVAIGGITVENAHLLKGIGLAGVAVSSGIMGAEDVFVAAQSLRKLEL